MDEKHSHGELRIAVRSTRPSSCSSAIPATETRGPAGTRSIGGGASTTGAGPRGFGAALRRSANRNGLRCGSAYARATCSRDCRRAACSSMSVAASARRRGAGFDAALAPSSARSMAATKPTIPPGLWHPTPPHRTSRSYQIRPYLSILGFSDRRLQFCMLSSVRGLGRAVRARSSHCLRGSTVERSTSPCYDSSCIRSRSEVLSSERHSHCTLSLSFPPAFDALSRKSSRRHRRSSDDRARIGALPRRPASMP